jgi:hypothetical protein
MLELLSQVVGKEPVAAVVRPIVAVAMKPFTSTVKPVVKQSRGKTQSPATKKKMRVRVESVPGGVHVRPETAEEARITTTEGFVRDSGVVTGAEAIDVTRRSAAALKLNVNGSEHSSPLHQMQGPSPSHQMQGSEHSSPHQMERGEFRYGDQQRASPSYGQDGDYPSNIDNTMPPLNIGNIDVDLQRPMPPITTSALKKISWPVDVPRPSQQSQLNPQMRAKPMIPSLFVPNRHVSPNNLFIITGITADSARWRLHTKSKSGAVERDGRGPECHVLSTAGGE